MPKNFISLYYMISVFVFFYGVDFVIFPYPGADFKPHFPGVLSFRVKNIKK